MREEYFRVGKRRAPVWALVTILGLVIAFGLFGGLVLSGEWDHLLGKDKVYVDGVNETGTITIFGSAVPYDVKAGCENCPFSVEPGASFTLLWDVVNIPGSNGTLTYTALTIGGGTGWVGTITPATPFSLGPAQSQVITLKATSPTSPGSYFVPVTLDASLH